jgi:Right handed beta helix region/Domain of unknown function DUF11
MKSPLAAALLVLMAMPLLADADLSIVAMPSKTVLTSSTGEGMSFTVRNNGPDVARGVFVTITATGGVSTQCEKGCMVLGGNVGLGNQQIFFSVQFPDSPGDVTFTASVTSSTPDPDFSNNSASMTVTVSPDPDVVTYLSVPQKADLALPFTMKIFALNPSAIIAHDVDVTVDFRSDVGVKSLPAGCSNPEAGRVVCHADALPHCYLISAQPLYLVTLVAPATYGDGTIAFTVSATEREEDFDPKSNSATALTPLVRPFVVTSTANEGSGSLRQAILDANAASGPLRIAFHIDEPSANKWKTIRITAPLPALTAANTEINGATQSGATNPDGPDIEISGGGTVDGDGLTIEGCKTTVANLAISGFGGNGISVVDAHHSATCTPYPELHHLFIGTDPTGSEARPNGRGIGISIPNGSSLFTVLGGALIHECVVSGNTRSGIFDLSGFVTVWGNRIGVKAHSDDPLPNGGSGIFIGNGFGSAIGYDLGLPANAGNVIAFNGQMGVAITAGVKTVSVRGNRIWGNGGLGIDIGLDGPTISTTTEYGIVFAAPTLTTARYDPVSKTTIVEGEETIPLDTFLGIDLYANDAADPSGFGQGQRPIGSVKATDFTSPTHFQIAVGGDLTGQWITATTTNTDYFGAARSEGLGEGDYLTQTSEFSRAIEVR